jgi:two-component system, response regulator YesN
MYRILIVDDEPAIVNGLVKMFSEYDKLDLDLYKAYSGLQALEIIKKTRMDIVLSDIRMPGMTGIQLHDHIVYYWPSCKVIFLTGYNEFDYVYEAIHKPGANYLLKTEKDDVIIGAVMEAISKIDFEKEQWNIIDSAKKQVGAMLPILKKELLESILLEDSNSKEFLDKRFKELNIPLNAETSTFILTGKVNNLPQGLSYSERLKIFYSIQRIFDKSLYPYVLTEGIVFEKSQFVWFLQPDMNIDRFITDGRDINWDDFVTFIKGELENIQNINTDLFGYSTKFILARSSVEWNDVYREFDLLRNINAKTLTKQSQMIIDLGIPNEFIKNERKTLSTEHIDFYNKLKMLESCLGKGNEKQVKDISNEILKAIKKDFNMYYFISIQRYCQFSLVFLTYVNKYDLTEKLSKDINLELLMMMEIPENWEKAEEFFVGLGVCLCKLRAELLEQEDSLVISILHKYINENLGGDISLSSLAEKVYFNPSYLSRFYKQITGRNLSEYINEIKLRTAHRMLEDTEMKINEIAVKLGFESPSYFTAFFRKMTGMTPQEYKNISHS